MADDPKPFVEKLEELLEKLLDEAGEHLFPEPGPSPAVIPVRVTPARRRRR